MRTNILSRDVSKISTQLVENERKSLLWKCDSVSNADKAFAAEINETINLFACSKIID